MGDTKTIVRGGKGCLDCTAIVDPVSGKLVTSKSKIKKVSLEYCRNTLTNNVPSKGYEDDIQAKVDMVKRKVLEKDGCVFIAKDIFDTVLSKFKKSGKKNYHFLVRAGKKFQTIVKSS